MEYHTSNVMNCDILCYLFNESCVDAVHYILSPIHQWPLLTVILTMCTKLLADKKLLSNDTPWHISIKLGTAGNGFGKKKNISYRGLIHQGLWIQLVSLLPSSKWQKANLSWPNDSFLTNVTYVLLKQSHELGNSSLVTNPSVCLSVFDVKTAEESKNFRGFWNLFVLAVYFISLWHKCRD